MILQSIENPKLVSDRDPGSKMVGTPPNVWRRQAESFDTSEASNDAIEISRVVNKAMIG